MFRNSTITDLFLFVFTQLILHYPYIPLPSGIVYKFIFSEKNLNNLCYYFNSQAVWFIDNYIVHSLFLLVNTFLSFFDIFYLKIKKTSQENLNWLAYLC